MSVQDIILYLTGELNFDLIIRQNYKNAVFKTEKFEKFAASCFGSTKYSNRGTIIAQMIIEGEKIIKENPELFHDQVVSKIFEDRRFDKYEAERGMKKNLMKNVSALMKRLKLGKIRGEKKK